MKYLFIILLALLVFFIEGCLFSDSPGHSQQPTIMDSLNQSMATLPRFTIVGDDLCIVSNDAVQIYDIQNPLVPNHLGAAGWARNILSIRSYKDSLLLIGDQNGLSLNKIATPYSLTGEGAFPSSQYYDPFVVKNGNIFLLQTKASFSYANPYPDELFVLDSKSLAMPEYLSSKNLYYPTDISIDSNNNLFVCDSGLKVFDVSVDTNINLKKHFKIDANKIAAYNDNLFILGNTGLYQYKYASDTINQLSKINIVPTP